MLKPFAYCCTPQKTCLAVLINGLVCMCVFCSISCERSHSLISTASTSMTTPTTSISLCHNTTTSPLITGILLTTPLHQIIIIVFQEQYRIALTGVLALSAVAVMSKSMGLMQPGSSCFCSNQDSLTGHS